ncbi:MAG: hypothetical protein N2691_01365 [Patescibacteria group bacterium]|nr:hypothetical protein [Patescibacteria group bacterium]
MKQNKLAVVAGPCSIDRKNLHEIYEIAAMTVTNREGVTQKAIAGTRIVGIKSRTELDPSGKGMGIDFEVYMHNLKSLTAGGCIVDLVVPPSVEIAEEVFRKTGMLVATEVMSPLLQLPQYGNRIPAKKLMPWNPAVNQLGWPILQTAELCRTYGWHLGIKNGKWVGEHVHIANSEDFSGITTMEKTWAGLTAYAGKLEGDIVLIHRGVDVPDKGDYRNAPVHNIAKRTKIATGAKLFFDPSHAHGPKMRKQIVYAVLDALQLKMDDGSFLYDGILIETGTSETDTDQHITTAELQTLVTELAAVRDLATPEDII